MDAAIGMYNLMTGIERARRQVRDHQIYRSIADLESMRLFMQHHVFAVWDFMSLIKLLQRALTSTEVPWMPKGDPETRRLVNEIVMEEESDEIQGLGYLSHFELYCKAMEEAGADRSAIESFLEHLRSGKELAVALDLARAPPAARAFTLNTFRLIYANEPHIVAAAFTFGREEPIPGMFRNLIAKLDNRESGRLRLFGTYLDRHVDVDENHHAPMAVRMIANLCGNDELRWKQAQQAALGALAARLSLWSGISNELEIMKAGAFYGLAA